MTMPTQPQPTATAEPIPCPYCGARGQLVSRVERITRKRRVKFGVIWLCVTIFTGVLPGLLLYLVWPRRKEVIGTERYTLCLACKGTMR